MKKEEELRETSYKQDLKVGDLATIDLSNCANDSTNGKFVFYNEDFKEHDIVVVEKKYSWGFNYLGNYYPDRFKVRNTQNGRTFVITWEKLQPIDEIVQGDYIYEV